MVDQLNFSSEIEVFSALEVLKQVNDFEGAIELGHSQYDKKVIVSVKREQGALLFVLPNSSEVLCTKDFKAWFDKNNFNTLLLNPAALDTAPPASTKPVSTQLEPLLDTIRRQRKELTKCLGNRLISNTLEEIPRLVLTQALNCLKANRLNRVQLLDILASGGFLVTEAWQLAKFEDLELITKIREKSNTFEAQKLKKFFADHSDEIKKEADRYKVVKVIFKGGWHHLEAWSLGDVGYQNIFPKLSQLLKVATKPGASKKIKILLRYEKFILEDLKITGSAVGRVCKNGDLQTKLEILKSYKPLIQELKITGHALGQLCKNGDLKAKLETLKANQAFLQELGLTGSAIGQLGLSGDLPNKLETLKAYKPLIQELKITGHALGQICLNSYLPAKFRILKANQAFLQELGLTGSAIGRVCKTGGRGKVETLKANQAFLQELGLTGSAIGQLCRNGDLKAKLETLKANQAFLQELGLTGSAIGQLGLSGDLSTKLQILKAKKELIQALGISGHKLGRGFVSAQPKVIQENIKLLSLINEALNTNPTFSRQANDVVFPQIFTKALAGFVLSQKWTTSSAAFQELIQFFGTVDFNKFFIETSGDSIQRLKVYIKLLTNNPDYQYLLATYLTGNKAVGQTQWAMLKKVTSGAGRGFSPFSTTPTSGDGKPLSEDRNLDFADSFNLEANTIEQMDTEKILQSFFGRSQIILTSDEIISMQSFVSSLGRDFDESFLEKLFPAFANAEQLKQFLLGEMEEYQIQVLFKKLSDSRSLSSSPDPN